MKDSIKEIPETATATHITQSISASGRGELPPLKHPNGKNKTQIFPYDESKEVKKIFTTEEKLAPITEGNATSS
tara:strand:+ start:303 stop:524 length:222 start_codon:yes stop_codon:yes gene_type:complete